MNASVPPTRQWNLILALFALTAVAAALTWVCAFHAWSYIPAYTQLEVELPGAFLLAVDIGGMLRGPVGQPLSAGILLGLLWVCARWIPLRHRARFAWTLAILLALFTVVLFVGIEVSLAKTLRAVIGR